MICVYILCLLPPEGVGEVLVFGSDHAVKELADPLRLPNAKYINTDYLDNHTYILHPPPGVSPVLL